MHFKTLQVLPIQSLAMHLPWLWFACHFCPHGVGCSVETFRHMNKHNGGRIWQSIESHLLLVLGNTGQQEAEPSYQLYGATGLVDRTHHLCQWSSLGPGKTRPVADEMALGLARREPFGFEKSRCTVLDSCRHCIVFYVYALTLSCWRLLAASCSNKNEYCSKVGISARHTSNADYFRAKPMFSEDFLKALVMTAKKICGSQLLCCRGGSTIHFEPGNDAKWMWEILVILDIKMGLATLLPICHLDLA